MPTQNGTASPIQLLRDSAAARSLAYYSSMVGVLLTCYRLPRDRSNPFEEHVHPQAFPGVVAITDLFTRLRPEDRAGWTQQPTTADLADLARGVLLGSAASAAVLGVGMAKGWMSAPAWGWERGLERESVLAAVAVKAAQEAVLVFNEEMIFRGYGLDTLRAAFGLPAALAISVPLFARYHGPGWKRFLGLSTAGLLLALLRLGMGNLWLAAGFHYGWNIAQKSIFGPEDSALSLRPLQLHCPEAWVGRPGHPDPGWLQILATLLMTVVAGTWLWRRRRLNRPT
jgi:membrane protease YdiL (CAAX protease family)